VTSFTPLIESAIRRSIVSYVRRSPRVTPSQRRWLDRHDQSVLLPIDQDEGSLLVTDQPHLDLSTVFNRLAPTVVEIGSGHGDTLVTAARHHPDRNFLGFEVFDASIARTIAQVTEQGLTNVRLIQADAVSGLRYLFADGCLEEVWVFFPDPWPKKRHHKRRIISGSLLDLLAKRLRPAGLFRIATDWDDYADAVVEHLGANQRFALISRQRFDERPITKFEQRAIIAGRPVHDFTYQLQVIEP
jgi:tRNA (guanine-N7-)-methyltransferase